MPAVKGKLINKSLNEMRNHPPYRERYGNQRYYFSEDGMQSFRLRFENLFSNERLFASKQTDIRVFPLVKCINLTLSY